MENKIICHCANVDLETIRKAIANGADTVEKISEITSAGTHCGGCLSDIEEILAETK